LLRKQSAYDGHFWAQQIPTTPPSGDPFHDLLSSCQSLQEVKDLVQRLEVDLLQQPSHSRTILKHLLSQDWGISELQGFILDGALHAPGSDCIREILEWFASKPHSRAHIENFYACIRNTLKLGLLSARDIQMLLRQLANIEVVQQETVLKLGHTEFIQDWYWMMADTMESCPIFNLENLGQEHLRQWSSCVTEAPFSPCALDAFRTIQPYLANYNDIKAKKARVLVKRWIEFALGTSPDHLPGLTESQRESKPDYARIVDFLSALQPAVAAKSTCQLTDKLVRDVMKGKRQPATLEIWMQILSRLSKSTASSILEERFWNDWLIQEALASGFSPRQEIAVRLWTTTRLAALAPEPYRLEGLQTLTRRLVRLFERQLNPDQDLLAELIFTFQSLPLPSPSAVLQKLAKCSIKNLYFRGSIDRLQADLLSVSHSRIALFKDDNVYKNAKINLNTCVTQLAGRATADPEAFLQAAHVLVTRDKLSVKIVTRILRHSLALNLSLTHAANPARVKYSDSNAPTPPATEASQPSLPATSLHLLNSLARSFALSPVLSPRQSFRKVYLIYMHLHRYTSGGAIGREIIRALWHAGVTRYKETGTSPEKVGWILGKVREIEGHEVADQLLWFGAGGVKWWKEWMQEGCEGIDDEGWRRLVGKRSINMEVAHHKGEGQGVGGGGDSE
jgi:hypothetical protein